MFELLNTKEAREVPEAEADSVTASTHLPMLSSGVAPGSDGLVRDKSYREVSLRRTGRRITEETHNLSTFRNVNCNFFKYIP